MWVFRENLIGFVAKQNVESQLLWEKCESNSSCLPHWSLDSHTICSSYSALFTHILQKMTKPVWYFYWSVFLFCFVFLIRFLSCFLRCPGFTFCLLFPVTGVSLSLTLCLSLWVEPWGIFSQVYWEQCSDPFICSYSMCVCLCPYCRSICWSQGHVYNKIDSVWSSCSHEGA